MLAKVSKKTSYTTVGPVTTRARALEQVHTPMRPVTRTGLYSHEVSTAMRDQRYG